MLVEDNAGWHRSQKVIIPEGIEIEFLPAYSPELQPAERLWQLVYEPLVNQYFETINEIEDILVERNWNNYWGKILMAFSPAIAKRAYSPQKAKAKQKCERPF